MKLWKIAAAVTAAALLPAFAASPQDPLRVGPGIYNLKLDNDRVRTFVVKVKPGQSIGVHKHPDHVVYAIQGGRISINEVGKDPVIVDLPTGATIFIPAQSHSAKNLSKTMMKLLVTEIK